MLTGLWYNHGSNFNSLSWFWRCKEYPCPLSPHLGLLRTLELPDWGFASWSWFEYSHWSWLWMCKEHPCPLSPHLGLWRMLEVPDWGFASWSCFGYCQEPCLDFLWSFYHTQISGSSDTVSLFRTVQLREVVTRGGWVAGGWPGGWSSFEFKDQLKLSLSRSI